MLLRSIVVLLCAVFPLSAIAMTDLNGRHSNLEKYTGKGKWLVVEAWHSNCRVCGISMPSLAKSVHTLPNTHVMSVSLDGNRTNAMRFLNRYNIKLPTLVSNIGEFNRYLQKVAQEGLTGTPTYLIFNPKGDLLGLQAGYISPASIKGFLRSNR